MTPTDVTSATVKLWIRGTDSVSGLSDGDRCPTLTDLSGEANDLTQGTDASRFIYRTNLAGGLPGFQIGRFINESVFEGHSYPIPDLGLTGGSTGSHLFAVLRRRAVAGVQNYGPLIGNNSGAAFGNAYPYSDGNIYDGFCSDTRKTVGDPTTSLLDWHILEIRAKDGLYELRILDGSNSETVFTTATNTFHDPTTNAEVGSDSRDSLAKGDFWTVEFFQFDGIVTDSTEYNGLISYLRGDYFVPTFTTAQAGNWTTGATWVGGVAPAAENVAAIISHDVTINTAVVIGGSPSNNNTYALTISDTKTLTVEAGGSLTLKSNINGNSTGTLQLGDVSGPATLVFDSTAAASATNYRMFGGVLSATSDAVTNRNSVSSNTGAGGSNAHFVDTLLDAAERIRFEDMGTASIPVFEFITTGRVQAANDLVFDRCGTPFKWTVGGGMQAADGFDLDTVTLRSSLATKGFVMTAAAVAPSVTRRLNKYISDKQLDLAPAGLVITNSILLDHGFSVIGPNGTFAEEGFKNNLVRLTVQGSDLSPAGDWDNCLIIADKSTLHATNGTYSAYADMENIHWYQAVIISGVDEYTVDNGIVESFGDDGAGDVFRAYQGVTDSIVHITRTIGVSQTSDDPGTLVSLMGGPGQVSVEHCTWQTSQRGAVVVGEDSTNVAGQILSFKSNLCWQTTVTPTLYMIGDWETNPSLPEDLANPANVSHNNWHGLTGAYAPSIEWSSAPGTGDLNVDPQFFEKRYFWMWVQLLEGLPAPTTADEKKDLNAIGLHKLRVSNEPEHADYDSRYTLAAYKTYFRAGYTPQNEALRTAGHDGATIGAVEMAAAASGSFGAFESRAFIGA